jgi:hypothetical protein
MARNACPLHTAAAACHASPLLLPNQLVPHAAASPSNELRPTVTLPSLLTAMMHNKLHTGRRTRYQLLKSQTVSKAVLLSLMRGDRHRLQACCCKLSQHATAEHQLLQGHSGSGGGCCI